MTRSERHRYYASREWALLKERVRERSGGNCERCGDRPYEQTHHLTYERLGNELLEDLQGLCAPCHEYVSGRRHDDPALPEFHIYPRYDNASYLLCPRGHNAVEIVDVLPSMTGGSFGERGKTGIAAVTVCRCRECNELAGGNAGLYALIQRSGSYLHGGWCRWAMYDPEQIELPPGRDHE